MNASAGRREYLTPEFCKSLTLTADHPKAGSLRLETEFLGRLAEEVKAGNVGYWLGQLRKAQKPKQTGRAKK
jgi:hypothetical protein